MGAVVVLMLMLLAACGHSSVAPPGLEVRKEQETHPARLLDRADRIVVGEVRGPEIVDLLAALNTGHEGGLATVHANAAHDVPARLEALAGTAGMDRSALHAQVAAGLNFTVAVTVDGRAFQMGATGASNPSERNAVRPRSKPLRLPTLSLSVVHLLTRRAYALRSPSRSSRSAVLRSTICSLWTSPFRGTR